MRSGCSRPDGQRAPDVLERSLQTYYINYEFPGSELRICARVLPSGVRLDGISLLSHIFLLFLFVRVETAARPAILDDVAPSVANQS